MVAYYNRSSGQEGIEPDHPSIRGYQSSYQLWLLQNKQCFLRASSGHVPATAAPNRFGEVLEPKDEPDIASSPSVLRPQPLLPISPQVGVSRDPVARDFVENSRHSAFQRILTNHHYEIIPQEADLDVLYDVSSNCNYCARQTNVNCSPHNELYQSNHHHVTLCVPNLNQFDQQTSSGNPHLPLPSMLNNNKIAPYHQHEAREYVPTRNILPPVQVLHKAAMHQMSLLPPNKAPHSNIMRTPAYGLRCDSVHHPNLLPFQPPWSPRTMPTNPIKTMGQHVSPNTYPVRTESVLCHGKQMVATTVPRSRVFPNGAYSNIPVMPSNPSSKVYPFRQNGYTRETSTNSWRTPTAQKSSLIVMDDSAGVTWCHTKRCKVSSSIDQQNHPCFLTSSVGYKQQMSSLETRTSSKGREPAASQSTATNKLEEMNSKVSLAMDMCSNEKTTGTFSETDIHPNDTPGEKRESVIRVSVVVPNNFCKASSNNENPADDDDWEEGVFKRTKQDSLLRARVLALLWVLLGERHLKEMGFPHEPVHRLLWTTVHVCCSVRGAKSAAAIPLDKDHNCSGDMTCFRDHTHRFLEVCAPTREHWKRFGWAGLTVDAVMYNIYTEELEPMFRSKIESLPASVRRAVEYLQKQRPHVAASSSTAADVQTSTNPQDDAKNSHQITPYRRKRGRPAKIVNKIDAGGRIERVMLWRFLLNLLEDPRNAACIDWVKREEGIFRIYNTDWLARQWGRRHGNPRMTYEKMARAMRTYYRTKVLQPVPRVNSNLPRKLVYKFNPAVLQKVAAQKGRFYSAFADKVLRYNALIPIPRAQPLRSEEMTRPVHEYQPEPSSDSLVSHLNSNKS